METEIGGGAHSTEKQTTRAQVRPYLVLTLAFVASRVVFFAAGTRFDTSPVTYFWQLLDPELLRTRLAESLFYLHAQPPLFNAILGIDLKLFPTHYGAPFEAFYFTLGLAVVLGFYRLATWLGIDGRIAGPLAVLLSIAPSFLLFENFLFYDFFVVALLTFSALSLVWFLRRPVFGRGLAFFACLGALALTRSMFHVLWIVALMVALLLLRRQSARTILLSAALPLVVVTALYVKNEIVFGGVPTSSSWLGMNLYRTTVEQFPEEERRALVAEGKLPPIVLVPLFSPLDRYAGYYRPHSPTGVPALDQELKSTGFPNLNNINYIPVAQRYLQGDRWVLVHRPGTYARGVGHALHRFFSPENQQVLYAKNLGVLGGWQTGYDAVVYLAFTSTGGFGVLLAVFYAIALLYGVVVIVRLCLHRASTDLRNSAVAMLTLMVGYVLVVGNAVDAGENYRFRATLDPLVAILVVLAVGEITRAVTSSTATDADADDPEAHGAPEVGRA